MSNLRESFNHVVNVDDGVDDDDDDDDDGDDDDGDDTLSLASVQDSRRLMLTVTVASVSTMFVTSLMPTSTSMTTGPPGIRRCQTSSCMRAVGTALMLVLHGDFVRPKTPNPSSLKWIS